MTKPQATREELARTVLIDLLFWADEWIGASEVAGMVAERYCLHSKDQCDHTGCLPDFEHDCAEDCGHDLTELEVAVRDLHASPGAPGTYYAAAQGRFVRGHEGSQHDVGDYRTCANTMCERLARILGRRFQMDGQA